MLAQIVQKLFGPIGGPVAGGGQSETGPDGQPLSDGFMRLLEAEEASEPPETDTLAAQVADAAALVDLMNSALAGAGAGPIQSAGLGADDTVQSVGGSAAANEQSSRSLTLPDFANQAAFAAAAAQSATGKVGTALELAGLTGSRDLGVEPGHLASVSAPSAAQLVFDMGLDAALQSAIGADAGAELGNPSLQPLAETLSMSALAGAAQAAQSRDAAADLLSVAAGQAGTPANFNLQAAMLGQPFGGDTPSNATAGFDPESRLIQNAEAGQTPMGKSLNPRPIVPDLAALQSSPMAPPLVSQSAFAAAPLVAGDRGRTLREGAVALEDAPAPKSAGGGDAAQPTPPSTTAQPQSAVVAGLNQPSSDGFTAELARLDGVISHPMAEARNGGLAPASIATTAPANAPAAFAVTSQLLAQSPAAQLGPVEVLLSPAELGHVRFEILHRGEQVQIVLSAERPDTLDLLRRNSDALLSDFRQAGFTGASLSFGGWGGAGQGNAKPFAAPLVQSAWQETGSATSNGVPIPASYLQIDGSRSLNLRV